MICIIFSNKCYFISSGVWSSPVTTGSTPPPCHGFSFLKVNGIVIMFGGYTEDDECLGDIYTLNIKNMVNKEIIM